MEVCKKKLVFIFYNELGDLLLRILFKEIRHMSFGILNNKLKGPYILLILRLPNFRIFLKQKNLLKIISN